MLDEQYIENYLMEPNDLSEWILFEYHNHFRNGKHRDDWSLLCSARDWIYMAVRYINNHPLPRRNAESFEVFAYISAIDVIVDAVSQMHRAVFPTAKDVFWGANECFPDNILKMNDYMYFKRLRACFGAHPVDIGDKKKGEELRFASWSGDFESNGNFSVLLYSEVVDGGFISLDIDFEQLNKYVNKYFSYLYVLKSELERQYSDHLERKRNELFLCEGDPVTRLHILQRENKDRLDNEYYASTIDQLIMIFDTPIACEENETLVAKYRTALLDGIEEIKTNIQNMNFVDLSCEKLLCPTPKALPNGWAYPIGKLSSAVFDTSGRGMFIYESEIEDLFRGRFVFEYDSLKELYVLVNAAMYSMLLEEQEAKNAT